MSPLFKQISKTFLLSFFLPCFAVSSYAATFLGNTPFAPNDPYYSYNSPSGFLGQWHLDNNAPLSSTNTGIDANLTGVWSQGITGQGVVIGFIDDGVEGTHPDLAANYVSSLSHNFSAGYEGVAQGPLDPTDGHATSVAGVAAARGGNGIGVTGAAPYASIAGLRLDFSGNYGGITDQNINDAYYWQSGVSTSGVIQAPPTIAVKNNSYGATTPFKDASVLQTALNRIAANTVISVFASGNYRGGVMEDANKNRYATNPNILVVAALGSDGKYASYSSFGANVFVTAPSSSSTGFTGITTTDRTGDKGYNTVAGSSDGDSFPDLNDTSTFGGTSSATPLVSGVMALGKEVNTFMGDRMAKYLLTTTSTQVDASDSSASSYGGWRTNGAGLKFDPNYGFGLINATSFINKLQDVAYVTEASTYTGSTTSVNAAITDGSSVSRTFTLNSSQLTQPLESVEIHLNISHTFRGDLQVVLTSPSGMVSRLTSPAPYTGDPSPSAGIDWTFLSNAFWGESGLGTWTLTVSDLYALDTGTWNNYQVIVNEGKMALLTSGANTISTDIRAESLSVGKSDATFNIPVGRTFTVRDGVNVYGGNLVVDGTLNEMSLKKSQFLLRQGTVTGRGSITTSDGFYNTGGTVNPGSISGTGTLSLQNNYTQTSGGQLTIEMASASSFDKLAVTGAAALGGTLNVSCLGGYQPALNTTFASIVAANSISGRFSSLISNLSSSTGIFAPSLRAVYKTSSVDLIYGRDYANPALAATLTPNQLAVGQMLNNASPSATGDLSTVFNAINNLTTYAQVANAYQQIMPAGSGALVTQSVTAANTQAHNISQRAMEMRDQLTALQEGVGLSSRGLDLVFKGGPLDGVGIKGLQASTDRFVLISPVEDAAKNWGFFVNGSGALGSRDGDANQIGYDFTSGGVTVGGDYRLFKNLAVGLMTGFSSSSTSLDDAGSTTDMQGYSIGTYVMGSWKGFYMNGMVNLGLNAYDMKRRIVFPGIDRTATAKPDGMQYSVFGEGGYDWTYKHFIFGPLGSLQYTGVSVDKYTETGAGALDLTVDKQDQSSLLANAGGRVSYMWDASFATFLPEFSLSLQQELLGSDHVVTSQLAQGSGGAFTTTTKGAPQTSALIGMGINVQIDANWNCSAYYHCQSGFGDYIANMFNVGARYSY
ncbi:MAG: autotransporter domain-containing protein [bacterium]